MLREPPSGFSFPASISSKDDLPAPLTAISATLSSLLILRLIFSKRRLISYSSANIFCLKVTYHNIIQYCAKIKSVTLPALLYFNAMTIKERYKRTIEYFQINMPKQKQNLIYSDPFELIVAVILSAQCTDKRVNMITPALLKKYPDARINGKSNTRRNF